MILNKKINRLVVAMLTFLSASLFFIVGGSAFAAEIENLHGFQLTENIATILVTSSGCTKKEDFIPVLEKTQPPLVTFIRLKPDLCRAASRVYPIKFSLEEIGVKEFKVVNKITPSPGF